ncbi:MAG: ABC transporter permease subunit [Bacteroidales bacterium]|nr:ABC transporter permease subunit [Bacteroidales bacterium]
MLKTIIIRELQDHLYSLRFIFALMLTLFLFGTSSVSFIIEFKEQKSTYEQGMSKIRENMKNVANNASNFAQNINAIPFIPRNSAFIASCQEESMPNTIIFSAFNVYDYNISKGNSNPFILPSKNVNWEFILVLLFSFLAIIFTFDTVSGEKEMRTLALGLSNPVSRGVMLTGKFLGTVIILTMFVVLGIVVSILILLFSGQTMITYATVAEILGFLLLSVLLIACASAIGLLTSVLSYRANTSLLIGLMVWLILLFIIPHTTLLLSNKLFPVESSEVITQNSNNSRKTIEASFPAGKWHSESNNPFTPDHKIRANMQMEFMLGEKKIRDNWFNSQFSQYVNTSKMTMISPMFIFEMGNEHMLNGGFQRFKNNWDDLHAYQGQFLAWFKAFDAKDPKSPHWYNPYEDYSTSKSKINIEEVPVYSESFVPFTQRISQSGIYIALLLVYTTIIFFVSFILFVKYDVR